jgi:hypothetical protein
LLGKAKEMHVDLTAIQYDKNLPKVLYFDNPKSSNLKVNILVETEAIDASEKPKDISEFLEHFTTIEAHTDELPRLFRAIHLMK